MLVVYVDLVQMETTTIMVAMWSHLYLVLTM